MRAEEQIRVSLHDKLVPLVGAEEAAYLMERNPPDPWADVAKRSDLEGLATRADLDALGVATRRDIEGLRGELQSSVSELRTEISELRTETRELRTDLRTDITGLRTEITGLRTENGGLRTEMQAGFAATPWRFELESVENRLRVEIAETRIALTDQLRDTYLKLVAVLVPSILAGIGIAFSAARFA